MVGRAEIERRLGYHAATPATMSVFEANRQRALELAEYLDETLPPGRELASALTAVQEALMWANAAVACDESGHEYPVHVRSGARPESGRCGARRSGSHHRCTRPVDHLGRHEDGDESVVFDR